MYITFSGSRSLSDDFRDGSKLKLKLKPLEFSCQPQFLNCEEHIRLCVHASALSLMINCNDGKGERLNLLDALLWPTNSG